MGNVDESVYLWVLNFQPSHLVHHFKRVELRSEAMVHVVRPFTYYSNGDVPVRKLLVITAG